MAISTKALNPTIIARTPQKIQMTYLCQAAVDHFMDYHVHDLREIAHCTLSTRSRLNGPISNLLLRKWYSTPSLLWTSLLPFTLRNDFRFSS